MMDVGRCRAVRILPDHTLRLGKTEAGPGLHINKAKAMTTGPQTRTDVLRHAEDTHPRDQEVEAVTIGAGILLEKDRPHLVVEFPKSIAW